MTDKNQTSSHDESPLEHLLKIGMALSSEKDTTKLLELILFSAKSLTNADGGTIYSITDDHQLKFETLANDTLGLYLGGTTGKPIPYADIPIYANGRPNENALVALAAARNQIVNIEDAYRVTTYDMSAARNMDERNNYRTQSVLTIPMANHEEDLNGVMQLINARDAQDRVIPFSEEQQHLISSLASLAAIALTNRQLIDGMETLFQSITHLIAKAIDEKSPYTGGHCRRVPELTLMIADAAHAIDSGPLADFNMSEAQRYELSIAGWLHDCGKIAIPEAVMDKATKLEKVFDCIALVDCRIELVKRDLTIALQQQQLDALKTGDQVLAKQLQQDTQAQHRQLDEDREFLRKANIGGEYMPPKVQQRVADIGQRYQVSIDGQMQPLLSTDEIYNLSISRGTINNEERQKINSHMNITIEMLESLPFPKHLSNVAEYAGGHHEKMDGSGYPKGLARNEMSVPARLMAIADIFEALTSSDRPYKKDKNLTECLTIMGYMKLDNHIDPDLFDLFIDTGVYRQYAEKYLKKEQLDDIDLSKIPGYVPPEQRG